MINHHYPPLTKPFMAKFANFTSISQPCSVSILLSVDRSPVSVLHGFTQNQPAARLASVKSSAAQLSCHQIWGLLTGNRWNIWWFIGNIWEIWWFMDVYPLVNIQKAVEHDHRNSWFTHSMVIFQFAMWKFTRGYHKTSWRYAGH